MDRLKVFTWNVHGSYLYYLSHTGVEFWVPVDKDKSEGYGGLPPGSSYTWPDNMHEVEVEKIPGMVFDVILYQGRKHYLEDRLKLFSPDQRLTPQIYLEHDPPREHPVDTKHIVDDPNMLLVHVTHFNNLMWDNNRTPTTVIEHGVPAPKVMKSEKIDKGVVVANNIASPLRGTRRMGLDVYHKVSQSIPLDVIGMGSEQVGGLGEIPLSHLPEVLNRYRFFFNPLRYTSMPLSVVEAMMAGLPIVGLATTEMSVNIQNGYNGFVHTDTDFLIEKMHALLANPKLADRLGANARKTALQKFNITRFAEDWKRVFRLAAGHRLSEISKGHS